MTANGRVNTEMLRLAARKAGSAIAAVALNGGRIQMRVPANPDTDTDLLVAALECDALAAADEIDRLRKELTWMTEHALQRADAHARLKKVIENAPHDSFCIADLPSAAHECVCWKLTTL